jgi:hypothetical protein
VLLGLRNALTPLLREVLGLAGTTAVTVRLADVMLTLPTAALPCLQLQPSISNLLAAAAVAVLLQGLVQTQQLLDLNSAPAAVRLQQPHPVHHCQLTHQGIAAEHRCSRKGRTAGVCPWCP